MENNPGASSVQEIMAKYDRETDTRSFTDYRKWIVLGVALLFTLFQLYAAFTGRVPATQLRPLHLGFVLTLVYLLYPMNRKSKVRKNSLPWYDVLLALLSLGACLYIALQHVELAMRISRRYDPAVDPAGYWQYVLDMIVGGLLLLLLFEACRRVVGLPILIIAVVFIVYGFMGRMMPGFLAHRGFSLTRMISHLVYTTEGVMGTPLGASATFIFLFVLFGAFLEQTGVGKFFVDLANAVAGHKRGGPAKVAVITSALEGTVSGSSVANTVGSGSFTIPMMKNLGYKPEFAAAVEAAASTGGQIMPPVMGAAAFLMAEAIGVSYTEIAKAAIIPALLYFAGIYIIVDLEAKKLGLRGLSRDQMPKLKRVFLERGYLIVPLIAIIGFLSAGYTPVFAALVGIASAALCGVVRQLLGFLSANKGKPDPETPYEKGDRPSKLCAIAFSDLLQSMVAGAKGVLGVAVACGVAGVIVGMITLSGLGLKLGGGLIELAGGNQLLTLVLTMLASIILGMGVPTTANYLITSTIMAPAVMQVMGCSMLTAHMFTFYFGIVADITPPVALAAMAGAAIAKASPMKTGFNAVKLAIAAFMIPYMFVFNEQMLLIGANPFTIIQMVITALIGMVGVGAALEGYYTRHANLLQRLLFLVGGVLLIDPGMVTDVIGLFVIGLAVLWQELENRKFGGRLEPSIDYYHNMSAGQRAKVFFTESFVSIVRLFTKSSNAGL